MLIRPSTILSALITLLALSPAQAQEKSIVVASGTTPQDSGLFGYILPMFKAKTGIQVHVIAQGTGQALDTGRRGDADVVFVHAKAEEEKFIADGFGVKRNLVMYNDFVVIGPNSDPASIRGMRDVVAAFQAIEAKSAPFVSRGDRSGTHVRELDLWKAAGIDIAEFAWIKNPPEQGDGGTCTRGLPQAQNPTRTEPWEGKPQDGIVGLYRQ